MKKLFALAAIALTITAATTAQAQEKKEKAKKTRNAISYTSVGPVIGLGDSWITGTGTKEKFNFAPSIGIGLVYSKNQNWGFGGELLLSREGDKEEGTLTGTAGESSIRPLYLRLPLHVTYFFGKYGDNIRPKIYLGPTFGVKLSESYKDESGSTSLSGDNAFFKSFDFGLNAGVGVNIKVATRTWLNLDAGYYAGLMNALKDADDTYRNNNIRLNIGLMFGL